MEIAVVLFIGFMVLTGNGVLIMGLLESDSSYISENVVIVFIAVAADLILLVPALKKIMASFRLAISGLKNNAHMKKESAKITKSLEEDKPDLDRLEELRQKRISEREIKQILHFCQLVEGIAGREALQGCLSRVNEKQAVLDEINAMEDRIFAIAESYKYAGNAEECIYYLRLLKAKKNKKEIISLLNECEEDLSLRYKERMAISLWKKCIIVFLVMAIFIFLYKEIYIPYLGDFNLMQWMKDF